MARRDRREMEVVTSIVMLSLWSRRFQALETSLKCYKTILAGDILLLQTFHILDLLKNVKSNI